jgi:hypothetical protein
MAHSTDNSSGEMMAGMPLSTSKPPKGRLKVTKKKEETGLWLGAKCQNV